MNLSFRTSEGLAQGIGTTSSTIQTDRHRESASNLQLGSKKLIVEDHLNWKKLNIDDQVNRVDLLLASLITISPDRNIWDNAKHWLLQKFDRIEGASPVPFEYSEIDLRSKNESPTKRAEQIDVEPFISSRGSMSNIDGNFSPYINFRYPSSNNTIFSNLPLNLWKREIKVGGGQHPMEEFQKQFDHMIFSLDTIDLAEITGKEASMNPTGNRLLLGIPIRSLFGYPRKAVGNELVQNILTLRNQQNEGAWFKIGGMSHHVASIRLQFNDDFFTSVGEQPTTEASRVQRRELEVAAIARPLLPTSPFTLKYVDNSIMPEAGDINKDEIESKMEIEVRTVLSADDEIDIVYLGEASSAECTKTATCIQINLIPMEDFVHYYFLSPEMVQTASTYQQQITYSISELSGSRGKSAQSDPFVITRAAMKSPQQNASVALIPLCGFGHYMRSQYYIMHHVFVPRAHGVGLSTCPLPIVTTNMLYSTGLVLFSSCRFVVPDSCSPVLGPERSTKTAGVLRTVNFTEHTTLLILLLSTCTFMAYLFIVVANSMMSAIHTCRKARMINNIARLEARAVECMIQGDFPEAVRLLEEGIRYISSRAGDQHKMDKAGFRHLLGKALMSEGNNLKAEVTLRKVLHTYVGIECGGLHVARILEDLGIALYNLQNRQCDAYQLLSKALNIYEKEMMLTVIAVSGESECAGVNYHAQVYKSRLMGDAIANAEVACTSVVHIQTQSPLAHQLRPESNVSFLDSECHSAVAELVAMLAPPTAVEVCGTPMPHSLASISRRIDVARVRLEMGQVLESSDQLEDAAVMMEEALDIFLELQADCTSDIVYGKDAAIIPAFITVIESKLFSLQNIFGNELVEDDVEIFAAFPNQREVLFKTYSLSNKMCFTPVKGDDVRACFNKIDGGSPDTVITS